MIYYITRNIIYREIIENYRNIMLLYRALYKMSKCRALYKESNGYWILQRNSLALLTRFSCPSSRNAVFYNQCHGILLALF